MARTPTVAHGSAVPRDRRRLGCHRRRHRRGSKRTGRPPGTSRPPASEPLLASGHLVVEVLSGLVAAANQPNHPLQLAQIGHALLDAAALEITIEATPWTDVRRAWALAQASLRYPDAVYVATAERHATALLTRDTRIERSGAAIRCPVITNSDPMTMASALDNRTSAVHVLAEAPVVPKAQQVVPNAPKRSHD
jgi:predicted nucleic acid-binding protein